MQSRFYIFITILCITQKNTFDKRESVMELLTVDKHSRKTSSCIYTIDRMQMNRINTYKQAALPVLQISSPFFTEWLIWIQYSNIENACNDSS